MSILQKYIIFCELQIYQMANYASSSIFFLSPAQWRLQEVESISPDQMIDAILRPLLKDQF